MPIPETGRWPGSREGGRGLSISSNPAGADTVLRLRGELDLRTVPQLHACLAEALQRGGDGAVVVDLGDVSFIDSTGLAALLNALRRMNRAGRRLVLTCAQGPVMRMLRLTRLDSAFTLHASADEALDALGHAPPQALAVA
jgi:anti-sigma B factor antagonist